MHDDLMDYFSNSSGDYHENARPLNSYIEEDRRQLLEKRRIEKELKEKLAKEEKERLYNQLHGPVDAQISLWRNYDNPDYTRIIFKIVNNTPHAFKLTQTSRRMTQAQMDELSIQPHMPMAFFLQTKYEEPDGGGYGEHLKTRFGGFFDYSSETAGFQFNFGMKATGGFSRIRGNWNEVNHTHRIVSSGKPHIRCTSEIIEAYEDPPFEFEVLITLG